MHDEPLNPDNLSPSAIDHLDQRIVRALETAPRPQIPADFSVRVASRLPARRPVSLTPPHYGQNATLIGIVVTLAALVVLALHSTGLHSLPRPPGVGLVGLALRNAWEDAASLYLG